MSQNFPMPPQRIKLPSMPVEDPSFFLQVAEEGGTDTPIVRRCLAVGRPDDPST